jgi:XTP/dITP diphosphohydrolase
MPLPFHRLILATTNPHKVVELSDLLQPLNIELKSLADWPAVVAVDEDGATPAENARKKAVEYARQLGAWVLADDTALCVDALGGEPGVKSARYAGERATMEQNRALLLEKLATVPDDQRTARFVCQLTIASPVGDVVWEVAGKCEGRILRAASAGAFGFGYDVLFAVEGGQSTLAELPRDVTAEVGHRGRAARELLRKIGESQGG